METKPLDTRHQHARQETEPSGQTDSGSLYWYLFLSVAICTAGFAAYVLVIEPKLSDARKAASDFTKRSELTQLQHSIERYKIHHGSYPPNATVPEIDLHLITVFGSEHDLNSLQGKTSLDLSKLDERESIWFWLGGQRRRIVSGEPDTIYDCRIQQLTDADHDGLMEYTSADGEYFVIRDGKVLLLDPVTNQTKATEDFERE